MKDQEQPDISSTAKDLAGAKATELRPNDVLLGRGCNIHPGNIQFRRIVKEAMALYDPYDPTMSRTYRIVQREFIAHYVLDAIRAFKGRFVRKLSREEFDALTRDVEGEEEKEKLQYVVVPDQVAADKAKKTVQFINFTFIKSEQKKVQKKKKKLAKAKIATRIQPNHATTPADCFPCATQASLLAPNACQAHLLHQNKLPSRPLLLPPRKPCTVTMAQAMAMPRRIIPSGLLSEDCHVEMMSHYWRGRQDNAIAIATLFAAQRPYGHTSSFGLPADYYLHHHKLLQNNADARTPHRLEQPITPDAASSMSAPHLCNPAPPESTSSTPPQRAVHSN